MRQYRPIQFRLLQVGNPPTIDSLSAFLPGMQVLAGDLESAIRSHLVYWNIWRRYSAIPESWDWTKREVEWAGWPGRPEFIESTYYLYRVSLMRSCRNWADIRLRRTHSIYAWAKGY
jgi:mannosidase alpha-like ER degradation enhancer 1